MTASMRFSPVALPSREGEIAVQAEMASGLDVRFEPTPASERPTTSEPSAAEARPRITDLQQRTNEETSGAEP